MQGIQFILLGLFLVGISFMLYTNMNGRVLAMQMARHPGLPLHRFWDALSHAICDIP